MTKRDTRYEVGYGKPPKHTRFKPGSSGNPLGRPHRSKNLKTIVAEELNQAITIRVGEKSQRITKRQAMIKRAVHKALEGDDRALRLVLGLDQHLFPEGNEPETEALRNRRIWESAEEERALLLEVTGNIEIVKKFSRLSHERLLRSEARLFYEDPGHRKKRQPIPPPAELLAEDDRHQPDSEDPEPRDGSESEAE